MQISRGKPRSLPRTPAGFTALALDGYGLCDFLPARPTKSASYPVAVRRVAISFHASFRRSLAVPPLRFTRASPPSGCTGDFHPQAAGHARHTGRCAPQRRRPKAVLDRGPTRRHRVFRPGRRNDPVQPNKETSLARVPWLLHTLTDTTARPFDLRHCPDIEVSFTHATPERLAN